MAQPPILTNAGVDPQALIQEVAMRVINAPQRGLPGYRAPSSAAFDAGMARTREAAVNFDRISRDALTTQTAAADAIKTENQNLADAVAADANAKQQRAEALAQQARDVAANMGMGIATDPDSLIAQLSTESIALREAARQQKRDLAVRGSVSILDNPLAWIENQFTMPGLVAQQNALVGEAAAKESQINQLIASKTNALNYANRTVPTISAIEAKAAADTARANANIAGANADRDLAAANIAFGNNLFARELSLTGQEAQALNFKQQEAQRAWQAQVEAVRFAASQDQSRLAAASLMANIEKRLGPGQSNAEIARGVERFYGMPLGSIPDSSIATLPPATRAAVLAMSLGGTATPSQALSQLEASPFRWGNTPAGYARRETAVAMAELFNSTAMMQTLTRTGTKPTVAQLDAADKQVTEIIAQQFANPEAFRGKTNLAAIPTPDRLFTRTASGTVAPSAAFMTAAGAAGVSQTSAASIAALVSPLLARPSANIDASTLVRTIMTGAQANGATPQQASSLVADYFRTAVTARNMNANFSAFGVVLSDEVANSYITRMSTPGLFNKATPVDLTKPENVMTLIQLENLNRNMGALQSIVMTPAGAAIPRLLGGELMNRADQFTNQLMGR